MKCFLRITTLILNHWTHMQGLEARKQNILENNKRLARKQIKCIQKINKHQTSSIFLMHVLWS
jgi:hypothetical protein